MAMAAQELAWSPEPTTFGRRLRYIRIIHLDNMTQADFATAIDVPPSTYATWEKGASCQLGEGEVARRIERVFGVPAAWTLDIKTGSVSLSAVSLTDSEQMELDLLYEERRRPLLVRF